MNLALLASSMSILEHPGGCQSRALPANAWLLGQDYLVQDLGGSQLMLCMMYWQWLSFVTYLSFEDSDQCMYACHLWYSLL